MVPAEAVGINVWSTSQLWEVSFSFPWSGISSAAKAGSKWAGGWRLRKGFPLSWLCFYVSEGLLLLPVLCSHLPQPTLGWFGQPGRQWAVGQPGISDGWALWIGSPWSQANCRAGRSTQLALRGRSKVASSPLWWQLTTGLTSLKHETSSSRTGQIMYMWGC